MWHFDDSALLMAWDEELAAKLNAELGEREPSALIAAGARKYRSGSLLTDAQRHEMDGAALRITAAYIEVDEALQPLGSRRRVYLCACERQGADGHAGCNTLVNRWGWCPECFNSRECRPELATPRTVEWACVKLERLIAWARGFNFERRRERVRFSEEVGVRRWSEDGTSRFEVRGTWAERSARGHEPFELDENVVVVARDGTWIVL